MDALLKVDDVGQIIAESIYHYFRDEINLETISRLKAAGLKFEVEKTAEKRSDILSGKTIVISGNFSVSRDEMKALIASQNSGSVSGRTTYLLAGEKPGPEKIKKAEALGIEIIDEVKFRDIIGENEAR